MAVARVRNSEESDAGGSQQDLSGSGRHTLYRRQIQGGDPVGKTAGSEAVQKARWIWPISSWSPKFSGMAFGDKPGALGKCFFALAEHWSEYPGFSIVCRGGRERGPITAPAATRSALVR
jgi:hypothetical protein